MTRRPATEAVRLAPKDYFDLATALLAQGSHDDLRISAMCDKLGVSKGSFYHHFGSLRSFVEAFLSDWERQTTRTVKEMALHLQDTKLRHRFLVSLVDTLPHDAEGAIRVWARTDVDVQAVVTRVDRERVALLHEVFAPYMPDERARNLAQLYHAILVGWQSRQRPVSVESIKPQLRLLSELTVAEFGPDIFGAQSLTKGSRSRSR